MWSLSGIGPESCGLPSQFTPSSSLHAIQVVKSPTIWTSNTRSVTGSTHSHGSLVDGCWKIEFMCSHDSPWSHERMTFSKAVKNMQPLDVMPMLGSAPSSPTLLKTKLRGKGW